MTPFFSVVMPVYNKEPHVIRAVNSVLAQSCVNFELLIVCDPSTDNSNARVSEVNDDRIRVFYRNVPGPGGYAARNLGIVQSRGKWIAFLDADDEWNSMHLKCIYDVIRPSAQMICSGWYLKNGSSITQDAYSALSSNKSRHLITFEAFFGGPRPAWTSAVCIRNDIFQTIGTFNERWHHGADVEMWVRSFLSSQETWHTGEITSTYNLDSVNMVTKSRFQNLNPTSIYIKNYLANNSEVLDSRRGMLFRYANSLALRAYFRSKISFNRDEYSLKEQFCIHGLWYLIYIFDFLITLMPVKYRKKLLERVLGEALN